MTAPTLTEAQRVMLEKVATHESAPGGAHLGMGEDAPTLYRLLADGHLRVVKLCWHLVTTDAGRAALRGDR